MLRITLATDGTSQKSIRNQIVDNHIFHQKGPGQLIKQETIRVSRIESAFMIQTDNCCKKQDRHLLMKVALLRICEDLSVRSNALH